MTILTNEFLESFDISISNFDDSRTLPSKIYTSEEFLDAAHGLSLIHI